MNLQDNKFRTQVTEVEIRKDITNIPLSAVNRFCKKTGSYLDINANEIVICRIGVIKNE